MRGPTDSTQLSFADFMDDGQQGVEIKSTPCINQNFSLQARASCVVRMKFDGGSIAKNYMAIKSLYPDSIVMYQVGEFFEMLGEDAKRASKCLALTLTWRKFAGSEKQIEMCGVPAKCLDGDVEKLLHLYNVAVVFNEVSADKNNVSIFEIKCALAISGSDIDEALKRGSGFVGGKQRIYDFFRQAHTNNEKVDFLKAEYGVGGYRGLIGYAHTVGENLYVNEWHDAKGIKYSKNAGPELLVGWAEAARRIDWLIEQDCYL